jgi:hypothetical protein
MLTAEPHKITIGNSHLDYRFNPWDHESTGLKISEILDFQLGDHFVHVYDQYKKYCIANNIDHSMARISSKDQQVKLTLSSFGFLNVETTYEISCRAKNLKNINTKDIKNKTLETECDISDLQSLASSIFDYGRFSEDVLIGKDLANKRYGHWAKQLCESGVSRKFLFSKDELIGFMFYDVQGSEVKLILGGLSRSYSHLGQKFWSQVFLSIPNDCIISTSISANNLGVLNLYSRFGFNFNNSLAGYHKKWSSNES